MKKIIILLFNILCFLLFIGLNINSSFAFSGKKIEKKQETIKELKQNIKVLKSKKVIVFSEYQKFKIQNGNIKIFFRENLERQEIEKIEQIIKDYNIEKYKIKLERKNTIEKLLILEKKFYTSLLPFIKEEKIESYNKFVKKAVETIKNSKKIKDKIQKSNIILNKKVSIIKDKIKENNKKQQDRLNNLLRLKIKFKIEKFKNSQKIKSLSKQKQVLIFKYLLQKIKIHREKLKNPTEKQKKLYSIIEDILINTIKSY